MSGTLPSETAFDAADNFTYGDLLTQLQALTPAQLNQQARWIGEEGNGKVAKLWVLDEDYVDVSGDGLEPASTYTAEEVEGEQSWPTGFVFLQQA